ncbi:hypothetical protein [Photobacterium sanguinicancri]|uniref:hypothetical protein n=1 Tax=Photobacterium sanguinicancri TaxID=875932 RepID=UPI0007880487|nr:hypothetical protein [Photobacterium sanguinicancri]KXI24240.1 hypothetical protein AS132_02625 [Photobacterium sanguinicancri]
MNIIYIEDKRRPERNEKYKEIISRLGYDNIIEFYDTTDPSIISNLTPDGVICHSGMEGYNIISYFAKLKGWPLLSYSGSVGSTPYLRKSKSNSNLFSVDSEYFESVLNEFINHCISLKGNHDE